MTELVLIDLSSIAHPIWHTSQSEPDPNITSTRILARVLAIANHHPHVAICCDAGRSFRKDITATYKANRPEHDASLQHQIQITKEQLTREGFPVWAVSGFEADDLVAAAANYALSSTTLSVLIVSSDKDLLQLVNPRVRAMSARDGSIIDKAGVLAKFGVEPDQMRDYLMLVGDNADNVKGANGVGPKKAAELLARWGTLEACFRELHQHGSEFKPAMATALREFESRADITRQLITLRTDVELPFDEILRERVPQAVLEFSVEDDMNEETITPSTEIASQPLDARAHAGDGDGAQHESAGLPAPQEEAPSSASTGMMVREPEVMTGPPPQWERQLDPRSMKDARILASDMHASKMFNAYGSPQAVLSTVMVGRELGLPAMASLRSIHNIEGKHALSASIMVALVLKSGMAEYFRPVKFSATKAVWETKRNGQKAVRMEHTIEMALQAWPKSKKDWQESFNNSGWGRVPTDMLNARCSARLARMVYPDLLAGLYTPEELEEIRESKVA